MENERASTRATPTGSRAVAENSSGSGISRPAVQRMLPVTSPEEAIKKPDGPVQAHPAPVQRKISYKRGQFTTEQELMNALERQFPGKGKAYSELVDIYKNLKESMFASQVFEYVIHEMGKRGHRAKQEQISISGGSKHGPKLPVKPNRLTVGKNKKAAMSSFNTASCTLGRLTIWDGDKKVSFHDRQIDSNYHAEDGLIDQLNEYAKDKRNKNVEWKKVKANITLNNFFCAKATTTKTQKADNCLDAIVTLQKRYKFAEFHVYFANSYGDLSLMGESIEKLQRAGIQVTAFKPPGAKKKTVYANDKLDDASESESESDEPRVSGKNKRGKEKEKSHKKQRFIEESEEESEGDGDEEILSEEEEESDIDASKDEEEEEEEETP